MKASIQAICSKLSANTKEKLDSIQFQLREDDMEKYGPQVLKLRRYDMLKIKLENPQSQIQGDRIGFFSTEFQTINTSISICVTDKWLICTLTFSIDNRKVFNQICAADLREKKLRLDFEEWSNPNMK